MRLLLIFLLIFCLASMTSCIFDALVDKIYQDQEYNAPRVRKAERHLPSICKRFYNLGAQEWRECMLVGEK